MEQKGLLDTRAAAAWLGVAATSLATLRVRGGGPKFVKIGRRALYAFADLEIFVNERKRSNTADAGPMAAA